MTVPFQLNKSQRLVVNGTAKESSRPALAAICVRKDKDGQGQVVAADGYMLIEKRVDYDGDESVLLDAKGVAACKDDKELGTVSFIPGADNSSMQAVVDGSVRDVEVVQGTFPDYERLYPTEEPVFRIGLGRDVLLKMLKCLDAKSGEDAIAFFFRTPTSPVEFRVGDDVRGMIMPLVIPGVTDWKPESNEAEASDGKEESVGNTA